MTAVTNAGNIQNGSAVKRLITALVAGALSQSTDGGETNPPGGRGDLSMELVFRDNLTMPRSQTIFSIPQPIGSSSTHDDASAQSEASDVRNQTNGVSHDQNPAYAPVRASSAARVKPHLASLLERALSHFFE